jgi:hypothetical protein
MKRRMALVGTLALVFTLLGCEMVTYSEKAGYMFRFRVDNNTSQDIKKVDFINGDHANDNWVGSDSSSVKPGERSREHIQNGFTIEYGSSRRKFGVRVTFEDGTTLFDWSSAGHETKILVSVYPSYIYFSEGNW